MADIVMAGRIGCELCDFTKVVAGVSGLLSQLTSGGGYRTSISGFKSATKQLKQDRGYRVPVLAD